MDKILATAWRLEKLDDIGELLGLLRFGRPELHRREEEEASKSAKRN